MASRQPEFPTLSAPAGADVRQPPRAPFAATYSIFDIARRLGQTHDIRGRDRSIRWLLNHVEQLQLHAHFPTPLPYFAKGEARPLHGNSRWPRIAVDHWLDGQTPSDAVDARDAAEAARAADILDARAASIGLRLVASK